MSFEVRRARLADYSVFPLGWLSERKTSVDITLGHGDGGADWAEGQMTRLSGCYLRVIKKKNKKQHLRLNMCETRPFISQLKVRLGDMSEKQAASGQKGMALRRWGVEL